MHEKAPWKDWLRSDNLNAARNNFAVRDVMTCLVALTPDATQQQAPFIYPLDKLGMNQMFKVINSLTNTQVDVPQTMKDRETVAIALGTYALKERRHASLSSRRESIEDPYKLSYEDDMVRGKIGNFVRYLNQSHGFKSLLPELVPFECPTDPKKSMSLLLLSCDDNEREKLFEHVLPELEKLGADILASRQKDGFGGRSR